MKATINHVMESWPLQLSLQWPGGHEQVMLDENVLIHRAGERVDPGVLQPGQHVEVIMRSTSGDGRVTELNILD